MVFPKLSDGRSEARVDVRGRAEVRRSRVRSESRRTRARLLASATEPGAAFEWLPRGLRRGTATRRAPKPPPPSPAKIKPLPPTDALLPPTPGRRGLVRGPGRQSRNFRKAAGPPRVGDAETAPTAQKVPRTAQPLRAPSASAIDASLGRRRRRASHGHGVGQDLVVCGSCFVCRRGNGRLRRAVPVPDEGFGAGPARLLKRAIEACSLQATCSALDGDTADEERQSK